MAPTMLVAPVRIGSKALGSKAGAPPVPPWPTEAITESIQPRTASGIANRS